MILRACRFSVRPVKKNKLKNSSAYNSYEENYKMDKKTLELLCKVNQLSFTEEQKDAFLSFMDERDADIKAIDAIDTENVEVMVHVMPIMTVVREDKVIKNFERDDLQAGAPETLDGYWQVPRVVE